MEDKYALSLKECFAMALLDAEIDVDSEQLTKAWEEFCFLIRVKGYFQEENDGSDTE